MTAARDAHLATVVPVQDQLALGSDQRYVARTAPITTVGLTPAEWGLEGKVPVWVVLAPVVSLCVCVCV